MNCDPLLVNSFARASTCGSRLFKLLDMDLAIKDAPGARDLSVTEGTLKFENVDFRYPGANDNLVLSDISFTARRGDPSISIASYDSGAPR